MIFTTFVYLSVIDIEKLNLFLLDMWNSSNRLKSYKSY